MGSPKNRLRSGLARDQKTSLGIDVMSTINRAAANISSAVAYGPTGDTNPSGRSHFEWSPGIDRMKVIAQILKKLRRHGYWGGKHTAFDELPKGMPKHLRGDVKEAAEEMIKEGLLLSKPTSYGEQVSLNPQRKADIDRIIKIVLCE